MVNYDAALKLLLKGSARVAIHEVSGLTIARWMDGELPSVEQRHVDLLGESQDGRLLHIELQSANDPSMPLRMMDYGVKVARHYGQYPKQVVLYVGRARLRMPGEFRANDEFLFRYRIVDIRDVDAILLLNSDGIGNVLAVLTRLRNKRKAVRQIVFGRVWDQT